MEKKYSIRLFFIGSIVVAICCLGVGFLVGTQKNWKNYEKRITRLQQQNATLLAQQELNQEEKKLSESLNVVEPYKYVLLVEDGYVAVYYTDQKTLYAATDIRIEVLPEDLQEEISEGKFFRNEEQLYNFLENYSS